MAHKCPDSFQSHVIMRFYASYKGTNKALPAFKHDEFQVKFLVISQ